MGPVSRASTAAPASQHLRHDVPVAGIFHSRRRTCLHAADHVARRVLEVGKWLALGGALPVPVSLHPREGARAVPDVSGRYVPVAVGGATYQIYSESAGSGQDVLCMHTAGADGRQFHGLMADPRIVRHHRLVSFDLPWHGKSPPPEGAIQGSWRLKTDLYVALIMGFVGAARLEKPVALGHPCQARSVWNWPTDTPRPSPASSRARLATEARTLPNKWAKPRPKQGCAVLPRDNGLFCCPCTCRACCSE
jgi:hypothetical protein